MGASPTFLCRPHYLLEKLIGLCKSECCSCDCCCVIISTGYLFVVAASSCVTVVCVFMYACWCWLLSGAQVCEIRCNSGRRMQRALVSLVGAQASCRQSEAGAKADNPAAAAAGRRRRDRCSRSLCPLARQPAACVSLRERQLCAAAGASTAAAALAPCVQSQELQERATVVRHDVSSCPVRHPLVGLCGRLQVS